MRYLVLLLVFVGCNSTLDMEALKQENEQLQKEVDSLKNELHKCEMLIDSYDGMPLNI